MKNDLNQCTFSGNLTADPEIRYTPNGVKVATFSIGINSAWRDSETDEERRDAAFLDFRAWGAQADFVEMYLKKGSGVIINCRAVRDVWESSTEKNSDGSGKKRSRILFEPLHQRGFYLLPSNTRDRVGDGHTDSGEKGVSQSDEDHQAPAAKAVRPRVRSSRNQISESVGSEG